MGFFDFWARVGSKPAKNQRKSLKNNGLAGGEGRNRTRNLDRSDRNSLSYKRVLNRLHKGFKHFFRLLAHCSANVLLPLSHCSLGEDLGETLRL
jgi:hypothetical protein